MGSIAAMAGFPRRKAVEPELTRSLLVGLVGASIGALYMVFARWGSARGLGASDMTFLRLGATGLITMPILVVALR